MQIDHYSLRTLCVEQILEDPVLNGRFFDNFDFQNYISRMRRDCEYADELCISAFCSAIKIKVKVLHPIWEATEFGAQFEMDPLLIAFNGHNHFDALLLKPKHVPLNPQYHDQPPLEPRDCEANNAKPPTKDTLTLLSLNVNSWSLHRNSLIHEADIFALRKPDSQASVN